MPSFASAYHCGRGWLLREFRVGSYFCVLDGCALPAIGVKSRPQRTMEAELKLSIGSLLLIRSLVPPVETCSFVTPKRIRPFRQMATMSRQFILLVTVIDQVINAQVSRSYSGERKFFYIIAL